MATNKNTMLPTYQATYSNMIKALNNGDIDSPCWVFLTDRECLVFIHYETKNGQKKLVPHIMLWDKIVDIETKLEGLVDEETGEPIKVTEYVSEQVAPIESEVVIIKEQVGNVIMLVKEEEENG